MTGRVVGGHDPKGGLYPLSAVVILGGKHAASNVPAEANPREKPQYNP
jgi:hypothetical protein